MTKKEVRNFLIAMALFVLAALLPIADSGYWLSIGVTIATYMVLSTSWALFSGPTHYISLATGAFYGIGMFIVGGGIDLLPYWMLVVIAGCAGAILAALIGLATLRLSGVYFVIFTLGLAEFVRQIVTWIQTTMGSSSGLYVLTDLNDTIIYWELLVLGALVYLIGWWINRSRLGFALRIIGNDEVVAVHCGINTAYSKVILFIFSGTVATIVGALLAPRLSYIESNIAFSPMLSFIVVITALLGGAQKLWGPIVGVIPFMLVWDFLTATFPNQTTLMLGICFLLVVYLIPNGFAGLIEKYLPLRHQER
ncbi:MAG: branched-chain amino acid ABC transporter permease [Rhodospirillales bacterium]|nr:branched-chain amino acid ABC transporter permease [Rhodospirillales bacterium]